MVHCVVLAQTEDMLLLCLVCMFDSRATYHAV